MLKRLLVLAILLVFAGGVAHAQSVPSCTLTGTVQDASGQPLKNGVINFDSIKTQVLAGGQTVARKIISINTDQNGLIGPNTFAQLLVNSITICDQLGNCGAPFSAIIPNQSTSPFGNMVMGTYLVAPIPNPAASGQVFGVNSNNTPEWQTVSGGIGNCSFTWNSTASYTLSCPGYAPLANPVFTGTVSITNTLLSSARPLNIIQSMNADLSIGIQNTSNGTSAQTAMIVTNDLSHSLWLVEESSTLTGANPAFQIPDSAAMFTDSAGGLNIGTTATTLAPIGFWIGRPAVKIAALNSTGFSVLTGVLSAPTLTLTNPLAIASGGTGNSTAPTSPQILIAQSATGYAPETVGGDAVLATNGNLTVTKTGGVALGPLATASTPLSVANGGTGSGTAPSAAQILIAQGATTYTAQTMSGDVAISQTGGATVSGLHFGSTNPIAFPTTAPISGGIMYFNSASTLQSSGMLTASAPVLGGGPGGAPTSGTRSGSTIVFGTTSGTLISNDCVKFDASGNLVDAGGPCGISGGATYPNGSPPMVTGYSAPNVSEAENVSGDFTYARAGTNSYVATVTKTGGIAFSALATASVPLSVANGGHGSSTVPTAGQIPIAQSGISYTPHTLSGDATITSAGVITVTKSGGTLLTGLFAPLVNVGANNYAPLASPSFSGTVTFPDTTGTYTSAGLTLPTTGGRNGFVAAGVAIPADAAYGGFLSNGDFFAPNNGASDTSSYLALDAGIYYSTGCNGPQVSSHDGTVIRIEEAGHELSEYLGNGLTVGSCWTNYPYSQYLALRDNLASGGAGLFLKTGSINASAGGMSAVQNLNGLQNYWLENTSAGASAQTMFQATNDISDNLYLGLEGSTFSTPVGQPYQSARGALLLTTSPEYLNIANSSNNNFGGIKLWSQTSLVGEFFTNNNDFEGLALSGFGNVAGTGNSHTSFSLGNGYLTGTGYAGFTMTGAARYDGTNWHADGGAGGGAALFNFYAGVGGFYYVGATAPGAVIPAWNPEFTFDGNGIAVTHIDNNPNYGVPTGATFNSGSRDTSGYVQVTGTWPLQINFAKGFVGSVACTGATLSGAGMVWFGGNTQTSIQVYCTVPGGAACSMAIPWISYHCFGES
jgi:hypothetical protein